MIILASGHKLTNKCGDGVMGLVARKSFGGRRLSVCTIKTGNRRLLASGNCRVIRDTSRVVRSPACRSTTTLYGEILGTFASNRIKRVCLTCARFGGAIARRTGLVGLLPIRLSRDKTSRGRSSGVLVGFRPGPRRTLRLVVPGCIADLFCKTLIRSFTDRGKTEVRTVSSTADGTRSVVDSLALGCGETHRNSVARRLARVVTKTGTVR